MADRQEQKKPIHLFYSYAQEDQPLCKELEKHLRLLQRQGLIRGWSHCEIDAGSERAKDIAAHLNEAQFILLLISPDFLDSDYCYGTEMQQALARHEAGEASVIPILLRPVSWEGAPFSTLQILPRNEMPIVSNQWYSHDEAWTDVVKELRTVIAKHAAVPHLSQPAVSFSHIWTIPYRRNPFFTGREDVLIRLHDVLHLHQPMALTQAISGLGGIGKTQIALEYAYRYRQKYRIVLWVSAATLESLQTDMVKLGPILHLPGLEEQDPSTIIAHVKAWLAQQQDWLLILDNADDVRAVSDYFPDISSTNGHILLTTRAQALGSLATSVEVEKMEQAEGALLLLRRARRLSAGAALDQASETAQQKAETIVGLLGGLPLALDQAGAYIEETGCGLGAYKDLYETRRTALLARRGRLALEHPEPVATTWDLSFRVIEQANPAAADLLRLCAFFNPDAIPEAIITEGGTECGPHLEALASDAFAFNQAIEELRKFSLLRRNTDAQQLSLHRLVQAVLKDEMNEETQRIWAERAIHAINHAFPNIETATQSEVQPYVLQAQNSIILSIDLHHLASLQFASLLNTAARFLHKYAYYQDAEPLYLRALAIREQVLGPDHPSTAISLDNLAGLYRAQGKLADAEPLYLRALAIREQALGPDHPSTATSLNNLASLYQDQGKLADAEPLFLHALAISEQAKGLDHPAVGITLFHLASLYHAGK